ncbi:[PSI+] inducibility protein 3 [Trichomonascus vanleenenianus]|uniref:[PSI+] inducibility protein 3 n=1 Tax=Trichomonascus vanleenenianus TaxID=2268995 RepID=UPI003ECAAC4B
MSNAAFINRSLTTIRNELEFLRDSGVITESFFNEFSHALPVKYEANAPPVDSVGSRTTAAGSIPGSTSSLKSEPPTPVPQAARPAPQQPNQEIVEAVYDYQPRDPTDLALYRGARYLVLERLNADWWKGRDLQNGSEGIFPSNYVKPQENYTSPPPPAFSPPPGTPAGPNYEKQGYGQPPPQSYATYPPPSVNYYPPPMAQPVPQQQPVVVQQDQGQGENRPHSELRKFGSKLGNAAIFGAGATIGSDLVNSIF